MEIDLKIKNHLEKVNLDIRKTKNGRFMDQKVTPNNLSFIAECVVNLDIDDNEFTVKTIWDYDYFLKNTVAIYNKPSPKNESAKHEYDKFIQQPLKMLSAAEVLSCEKRGTTNYYKLLNKEILFYISIKERNAFIFMYHYLVKVLKDSEIFSYFETFRLKQDKDSFKTLKERFIRFIIGNTPINTSVEVRRIFPKILNVFSAYNSVKGTTGGRISKNIFYFSDLTYNSINFRDKKKDKTLTRTEALTLDSQKINKKAYGRYLVDKAKKLISTKYIFSEVKDKYADGPAIHVHHIFPQSSFPKLAYYLENLIKLTATQHLYHAHNKGNTHEINKDYQCVCLIAKSESIETSVSQGDFFYSKNDFIYVLNVGLDSDINSSLDFDDIRLEINKIYNEA